jgi:peptidoglycan biosynthesis protein MviN/MurJ (putative lipid II flippase)
MVLWVCGFASINLVYGRGEFGVESLIQTTWCLWGYSFGLLPAVIVMILAPAFFVQGDYRTPAKGAVLAVIVNIGLNALMIFGLRWGPASVAFATSISALVNAFYLIGKIQHEIPRSVRFFLMRFFGISLLHSFCFLAVAALMGIFLGDPTRLVLLGDIRIAAPLLFSEQLRHYLILGAAFALPFLLVRTVAKLNKI